MSFFVLMVPRPDGEPEEILIDVNSTPKVIVAQLAARGIAFAEAAAAGLIGDIRARALGDSAGTLQ
jgi:hypothetical protein